MAMAKIGTNGAKHCAFCMYWEGTDPVYTNGKYFKYQSNEKGRCRKRNGVHCLAGGNCSKYEFDEYKFRC